MSSINSVSSNYAVNAVDFPPAKSGGQDLTLTFSPEQIGAKRGRDNKFPPEARFTSTQAEKALFRFFGLNPDNPKDLQKIKARLATDGKSPFDVLQASTNYPARFNQKTGRYEAVFHVSQKTYDQLRGKIEQIKNEPPSPNAKPLREPNPNDFYAAQQKLKLKKQMPPSRLEIEGLTAEQKALLLDLTDIGLSVVGIFEPTPFADLAGTGLALSRGEYGGAIISALGMFPYLGDLAKLGKLPKLVKVMENVVQMAKADGKFAKVVTPLLEKIKTALDNLPIEKLPQKAQDAVKAIKNKIDEFFSKGKIPNGVEPPKPPKIRTEPPEIKRVKVGKANLPATTEMSIQDKLYNYLLDFNHSKGGPKAKWFKEALGFTRENMDDLAKQLIFNPAKAVQTEVTEFGTKYNQIISVKGANGRTIDVLTSWIRNEDGIIRIITAVPTKK